MERRRKEHYFCDKTEHLRRPLKKKKKKKRRRRRRNKKKKNVMMVVVRATMSLRSQFRIYLSCSFVILALEINVKGCKNRKEFLPNIKYKD